MVKWLSQFLTKHAIRVILQETNISPELGVCTMNKKVQVGNDQEMVKSEKIPTPKIEVGKN